MREKRASSEISLRSNSKLEMLTIGYSPVMFEEIHRGFEEIHGDVNVGVKYATYDAWHDEIVAAMMDGGTRYDICAIDNVWLPELVEAGWLADITDYFTPEMKKTLFPQALEIAEYPPRSGRHYGWPWHLDTKYLLYHKGMLKKAGIKTPPRTLNELWSQAMILKKKGIVKHPIVWSWAQEECLVCDFTILTALFGGKLVDESGKPAFNNGGAVDALKWMLRSVEAGITSWASIAFTEPDVARGVHEILDRT